MRPLLAVTGVVIGLLGAAWALQGAYLLPATFMRGPAWIGIGAGIAGFGILLVVLGFRARRRPATP